MCLSSPNIPAPPPPPQEAKAPDSLANARTKRKTASATMLTGPSGVAPGTFNTGGTTPLGG